MNALKWHDYFELLRVTSSQGSLTDWTFPPCISLRSMRAAVMPVRPVLCLKEVTGTGLMSHR